MDTSRRNRIIPIAGNNHCIDSKRKINGPHQITKKRHRSFEHTHENKFPALIVFRNLCTHFTDSLLYLHRINQNLCNIFVKILHLLYSPFSV